MAKKTHKNTLLRAQLVCEIAKKHYEEGNLAKCYKMVWRRHVYPVYPMCYRTFLHYLRIGIEDFKEPPKEDLPSLFDNIEC